jgi:hypothetical protein
MDAPWYQVGLAGMTSPKGNLLGVEDGPRGPFSQARRGDLALPID